MTVTVNDLVLSVRRQAGDWGAALMTLDTQMAADATTLSVVSRPDVVDINQYVEVDTEEMEITDVTTNLTVARAAKGTTATIHESGVLAIVRPRFTNLRILAALVRSQRVLAGYIPDKTITTTTSIVSGTEEYAMPAGTEYIDKVELETSTSGLYRIFNRYEILDQYDPPRIRIPQGSAVTGKYLRLTTLGQYAEFLWGATISDIPLKYHNFLIEYACGMLIEDELTEISGQTEQAHGVSPTGTHAVYQQQIGRNMQAAAFAHLEAVKPMTRIIHRQDQRVVRM
jgi:hypothetical protein